RKLESTSWHTPSSCAVDETLLLPFVTAAQGGSAAAGTTGIGAVTGTGGVTGTSVTALTSGVGAAITNERAAVLPFARCGAIGALAFAGILAAITGALNAGSTG